MDSILKQLKQRRTALGLKQQDMMRRIGVSRQQYQRLESKGNPRLDTLELIAQGLNSQLVLIPLEKLNAVQAILGKEVLTASEHSELVDNPWKGLLDAE